MSAPIDINVTSATSSVPASYKGRHYGFIEKQIPAWYKKMRPGRQQELHTAPWQVGQWYTGAAPALRSRLHNRHEVFRTALDDLEATLANLQDVRAFCAPLLAQAITEHFGQTLDVNQVSFARKFRRGVAGESSLGGLLVFQTGNEWQADDFYIGTSLLHAALGNFEAVDARRSECEDCRVITRFNFNQGDIQPDRAAVLGQRVAIEPHAFAQLCRELDLGRRYQEHLKAVLAPADPAQAIRLRDQVRDSQQQMLAVYTQVGYMQRAVAPGSEGGLGDDTYRMLQETLSGNTQVRIKDRPVVYSELKVLGVPMSGILLIGPERDDSTRVEPLLVYIPGDPLQPLREYDSSSAFMVDLRERLHGFQYRRFFSRFVPLGQQGEFFAALQRQLDPQLHHNKGDDFTPLPKRLPLHIEDVPIQGPLWSYLAQAQLNKMLTDARAVAVATADADTLALIKHLEGFANTVMDVLNLAAFWVPGLGALMMAVGAGQLASTVFEGIEDWEDGQTRQMWAHFSSVLLNLGAVATGAVVLPAVRTTPFVEGMQVVETAEGQSRLWNPSIDAYEHPIDLPPTSYPNAEGLHEHSGKTLLKLEGRTLALKKDSVPGSYRLQHPTRAHAYQPRIRTNGHGAWVHEAERPLAWRQPLLMRRLGLPGGETLSDEQLEQVRVVSGVSEDELRRVHVESEPTPAIVLDTARQFRAYADAVKVGEQVRGAKMSSALCTYAAQMMTQLPGWPAGKAIEVFEQVGQARNVIRYGSATVLPADIVPISRLDLMQGQLSPRVLASLNEEQIKSVLGQYVPRDALQRSKTLDTRLADHIDQHRSRLFMGLYLAQQPVADPLVQSWQRSFPSLSTHQVQELLAQALPSELAQIADTGKIPLRLGEQAHRMLRQMREVQAYEGLYLDALAGPDTERLVLHTLEALPGWIDNLRIEVREGGLTGELRAAFGSPSAENRKVLVRLADGCYQAYDGQGNQLHGVDDLYASLQHALPDKQRTALGSPHVGQGEQLRALIQKHALPRDKLRVVLNMRSEGRRFFNAPQRLPGGRLGYPLAGGGGTDWEEVLHSRVQTLYPRMTEEQRRAFILHRGVTSDEWLVGLEQDYKRLVHRLGVWAHQDIEGVGAKGSEEYTQARQARRRVAKAIKDAWQMIGPQYYSPTEGLIGMELSLSQESLAGQLSTLPVLDVNLDHVLSVDLSQTGISDADIGTFLHNFPKLRDLNLEGNELTALPQALAGMRQLRVLSLSDNDITLTLDSQAMLKQLGYLFILELGGNPLELSPDISRMPGLELLSLPDTGLDTWPTGLFAQPRARTFQLDLSYNPIERIPEVAPGSDRAQVLARSQLSRENLSPANERQMRLYIESVGLDPNRRFSPRGQLDSGHWRYGLSADQWLDKQPIWNAVEESLGSEHFFDELRKLSQLIDGVPSLRPDLTTKVWRMLEAMQGNTQLREKLFLMAAFPTNCVDAGAQLFNAMGVEVMLHEAYAIPSKSFATLEVFELAKGKSRLDELGRIAHRRVSELQDEGRHFPEYDDEGALVQRYDAQGRGVKSIDEVEIHLAYATALADPLDLPWQTREMQFNEPDVTPAMIESARTRVLALEEGDQLRDNVIEQQFWREYLEGLYPDSYKDLGGKSHALSDLQVARATLADDGNLADAEKARLRQTIESSAKVLGKAVDRRWFEHPMSAQEYEEAFRSLGVQFMQVHRALTDKIMGRSAASHDEPPLVHPIIVP